MDSTYISQLLFDRVQNTHWRKGRHFSKKYYKTVYLCVEERNWIPFPPFIKNKHTSQTRSKILNTTINLKLMGETVENIPHGVGLCKAYIGKAIDKHHIFSFICAPNLEFSILYG